MKLFELEVGMVLEMQSETHEGYGTGEKVVVSKIGETYKDPRYGRRIYLTTLQGRKLDWVEAWVVERFEQIA